MPDRQRNHAGVQRRALYRRGDRVRRSAQTYADFELLDRRRRLHGRDRCHRRAVCGQIPARPGHPPDERRHIDGAESRPSSRARARFIAILDSDDAVGAGIPAEADGYPRRRIPRWTSSPATAGFSEAVSHGSPARPWPDSRPAPTLADILADETAVFIMSVFRRRVYTSIGPFDEELRSNEDYDFWLRAAVGGFTFSTKRSATRPLPPPGRQPVSRRAAHAPRHPSRVPQAPPGSSLRAAARDGDSRCANRRFETEHARGRGAARHRGREISRRRGGTSAPCMPAAAAPTLRRREADGALVTGTLLRMTALQRRRARLASSRAARHRVA